MRNPQLILGLHDKLLVDIFAGAGGVSDAIEAVFGRHVDVAINHDENAISVHMVNHPQTTHYHCDVREVDPLEATQKRYVGHIHLSPDCTHHSQARGGQPRNAAIRALAWVAVRWVGRLRKLGLGPDQLTLENVEQMVLWSPLVAKRDPVTGRVIKIDGSVAAPDERVPLQKQFLVPDPKRKGKTWNQFVRRLRELGGTVEWKTLCAADYGERTATSRERLVMVCRFDGESVAWPKPHRVRRPKPWLPVPKGKKAWLGADTAIDFTRKCPSIFERPKPLAHATHRRLAVGIQKCVIDCPLPYVVPPTRPGEGGSNVRSLETARASRAARSGEPLAAPTLIQFRHDKHGKDVRHPLPTVTAGGDYARPAGAATQWESPPPTWRK